MALNLGATAISTLRLGTATPSKVMLGATQVWPVASGDLWTPADLAGTGWEWFDYNEPGTITLSGNKITRINSLRAGSSVYLEMPTATHQPDYQPASGGIPGRLFGARPTTTALSEIKGLRTNPILTGEVDCYTIVNHEMTDSEFPPNPGLVSFFYAGNESVWPGDIGYGEAGIYNSYINPSVWLIEGRRQNGFYHPAGTPGIATPPVMPWRNIWAIDVSVATISATTGPRRVTVGFSENINGLPGEAGTRGVQNVLYEQLMWKTSVPTQADIERVEGYIAWKPANAALGLVALLPANHPYKNAAPTK